MTAIIYFYLYIDVRTDNAAATSFSKSQWIMPTHFKTVHASGFCSIQKYIWKNKTTSILIISSCARPYRLPVNVEIVFVWLCGKVSLMFNSKWNLFLLEFFGGISFCIFLNEINCGERTARTTIEFDICSLHCVTKNICRSHSWQWHM